jgi:phosphonoacetaldehyde hydrolase
MIFRIMETLGVYPPRTVVKVGDTAPDVEEALNAGTWAVGVAATGSSVGLRAAELDALPAEERATRIARARQELLDAGAHYVIDSVRDLPPLLLEIEARMARAPAEQRS